MMSPQRLSHQEFSRTLWRTVAPPLLLLSAHAALISLLLLHWASTSNWVRRTEQTTAAMYEVERILANMESGLRGFRLTGDEQFMEPYNRAKAQIGPAFRDLERDLVDDPAQTNRLHDVVESYTRWVAAEPVVRREFPVNQAALTLQMRQQKDLMDFIRRRLRELILTQTALKNDRYERERRATSAAILGGIGLSVLLAFALALIIRRTVKQLQQTYRIALEDEAASAKQFLDLAETIPQLIWITDGQGREVYYNKPWSDFTGAGLAQLSASGWHSMLHPEDATQVRQRWQESLASGKPFELEYRLRRQSNGYRWFLCRAVPIVDSDGRRVRWFGTCTDIDEQKQVQQQREAVIAAERQARADLLRTSRAKDEFLATLSHELRTPMTAILGWARLLRDPAVRQQHIDRAVEAIDVNARAQARLIDDLLDMSRIISGKLVLKTETVELARVVRAGVDSVGPAAENKQIGLEVSIEDSGAAIVNGDAARLQQVVWNLLSNAVKFTPAGGRVSVNLQTIGPAARLTITDTGRGIPASFLPYVFERFSQADGSTTRQHGGMGLGLAIVRNLVELHGGTVSVSSQGDGHGATFTVNLPIARSGPARVQPDRSAQPTPQHVLAGKRVLLVDDDPAAAMVIQTSLVSAGAVVTVVHSASHALAALEESAFDLLISDIAMPNIDGYGLIARVRDHPRVGPRIPAIALSALTRKEDRRAALAAGFDLHLGKPVSPEDLVASVASLFEEGSVIGPSPTH